MTDIRAVVCLPKACLTRCGELVTQQCLRCDCHERCLQRERSGLSSVSLPGVAWFWPRRNDVTSDRNANCAMRRTSPRFRAFVSWVRLQAPCMRGAITDAFACQVGPHGLKAVRCVRTLFWGSPHVLSHVSLVQDIGHCRQAPLGVRSAFP